MAVWRPQPEAPSTPQRATAPNCLAHASIARCPSPDTRKCSLARIPPRGSTTVAVNVRLCGSIPTTFPAWSGVSSRCDGPGPRLIALLITWPSLRALCWWRIGRQHPGERPRCFFAEGERSLLGQAGSSKNTNRGRHFVSRTPLVGESDGLRARPRFSLRPSANRRPRRAPQIEHRDGLHWPRRDGLPKGRCRVTVALVKGHSGKLAGGSFTIAAGQTRTLKLSMAPTTPAGACVS